MITWRIDPSVMFDGFLRVLVEDIEFPLVSPEAIIAAVLLLDEGIVVDVGGQEGLLLRGVAALGDLSEGAAELVLAVLAGNVAAVSGHLCALVHLTHP